MDTAPMFDHEKLDVRGRSWTAPWPVPSAMWYRSSIGPPSASTPPSRVADMQLHPRPGGRRHRRAVLWVGIVLAAAVCGVVREASVKARRRSENRRILQEAAVRVGVDPSLLLAVAEAESGFDACARSARGAVGLLQVLPDTGAEMAASLRLREWDLCDPRDNGIIGAEYLRTLLRRYRRDVHLALAAYHAGPGRADEWLVRGRGLPGPELVERFAPPATRAYVFGVVRSWEGSAVTAGVAERSGARFLARSPLR